MRRPLLVLLAGILAGVAVLGAGGRIAMGVLRVAAGTPAELSVRGTLEVLLAGGLFGALGGIAYLVFDRVAPAALPARAVVFGGVAYGVVALASRSGRAITLGMPPVIFGLAVGLFAVMFVGYGVAIAWLVRRFTGTPPGSGDPAPR